MERELNKIFWGFLIVFINFYLFVINISPNTVGYFIAAAGLSRVNAQSSNFSKAKRWAILLGILSIPNIIKLDDWLKETPSIWSLSYSTIMGLFHMIVVLYILMGIIETTSHNTRLQVGTRNFLKLYLAGSFLSLFFLPFILNVSDNTVTVITLGSAIISIVLEIIFLVLLQRYRSSFILNHHSSSSS